MPTLVVTVVDATGTVRPEAVVAIVGSPVVMPEVARLTNIAGECRLQLQPGEYVLEAYDEGYDKARKTVIVPTTEHIQLELRRG